MKIKSNKNKYYYSKKIYTKIKNNKKIKEEILVALKKKEFKLYIQPKYKTETKIISGGEVLIRWNKNNEIIYPDKFINELEKRGLIYLIDIYVLKIICKKLEEWNNNKYKKIKISINQSQENLLNHFYISKIKDILNRYNFNKQLLEIELTESIFIKNKNKVKELEEKLHSKNLLISIDDFGTGYSSYYLLSEIKVDILKLDKKLFNNLENERALIIVEAIINLAKKLNIKTIAEGIETDKQYEIVKKLKCDEIQGYYFAKPMPIEEFEKIIK